MATKLGDKVRERRLALELSQAQLAAKVGVERSYIGHIERGRTGYPGRPVLEKLAGALGFSVEELALAALETRYTGDLSDQETLLLAFFRRATAAEQRSILDFAGWVSRQEDGNETGGATRETTT